MLLQFKAAEDEEDCPLPEEVRQDLLEFHRDLLTHCGTRGDQRIHLPNFLLRPVLKFS